ncbi:50S ribosomal protein L5 [Neolewinella agarilytica]|uniref:Large ribosomal subunit protein uL5 n=1 Tax=Neolewinella agarilytica TaxID=478744 RepID=A0A1H9C0I8_9BACT|nr:50S ribosomal protein L5 [Neolewinella agarilytica]SEP94756.1 LSU ribosomal protein L5P [Neolewinella agarilytica]
MSYTPRLKKKYDEEVRDQLNEQFGYASTMQVPRLLKICINQGVGKATQDRKLVENAAKEMTLVAGQQAVITKSKKSVSNFRLRDDMGIGAKVTLRRERMYDFLDRLISAALPRVRDFRGINDKSFDGRGNYTMGITEQIIFPEISLDDVANITGYDVTFVTSAKTDAEALALLKALGLPFKNQNNTNA